MEGPIPVRNTSVGQELGLGFSVAGPAVKPSVCEMP